MKKFIPMFVLMLAVCLSVSAQMNPNSGQSSPTAGQAGQSYPSPAQTEKPSSPAQTEASSGQAGDKTMSITGCISESGGKFLIADKAHPSGVQLVTSEDLKPHVGHKVKVSGTMDNAGSTQAQAGGDASSMVLKVSNMKMISEHCEAPK